MMKVSSAVSKSDDGQDGHRSETSSISSHHTSMTRERSVRRFTVTPLRAHQRAEQLAKKRGGSAVERFLVKPDYAYPDTRMNRDELRLEMNKPSQFFHDLRLPSLRGEEIGLLRLEVLQCFGLPRVSGIGENESFCIAVCGGYAFKTDTMPPVANPMWLSKMRRACIFPLFHAYARLYVGVFDDISDGEKSDFAGRIVLDLVRMRPNSTYDVTLPLRQSGQVYMKRPRGAIRVRFEVSWYSEREALLSYLPKQMPKFEPNESVTVNCCDKKSFQNVALVVHGTHMPGRFSMKEVKAVVREINFTRIHILRYMRKREMRNLMSWKYPFISGFLFFAWMHSVYANTVRYVPGHFITLLLLYLWKNYANYAINSSLNRGFLPLTWEEMFLALCKGGPGSNYFQPLEMALVENQAEEVDPLELLEGMGNIVCGDKEYTLEEVADAFRKGVQVSAHRYRLGIYRNTFVGSDAVSFLVNDGYARSRDEAVVIGCQLMERAKLFEHVTQRHGFKDEYLFYHFLIQDDNEYTFETHQPGGKVLFRMMGFLDDKMSYADQQLEMPFGDGVDHPRITVKDSLVIRSKQSKKLLLMDEEKQEEQYDARALGVEGVLDEAMRQSNSSLERFGSSSDFRQDSFHTPEDGRVDDDTFVTVKQLKKPPQQDIDKRAKADRTIPEVLAEARYKVHGVLLHCFNDRTHVVRDQEVETSRSTPKRSARKSSSKTPVSLITKLAPKGASLIKKSAASMLPKGGRKRYSRFDQESQGRTERDRSRSEKMRTFEQQLDPDQSPGANGGRNSNPNVGGSKKKMKSDIEIAKEENDRLLKIGAYSNANRFVAKIGVIVQPIVEIAYGFLFLFRALFNIFTWRDPMASFWVSIIGFILIPVLHLFPWRIVMGVAGVVLVGPQNWVLRIHRERKGIVPPDMDQIVKKKKKGADVDSPLQEEPLFCDDTYENNPQDSSKLDQSNVRHIVVPYSPLMYSHRFYDWPPEPEYARVGSPDCAPETPLAVQNDDKSLNTSASATRKRQWLVRRPGRTKKKEA